MKVLLTGAAGFVGGAVARQLTARGDEVVGVDALIPQAHRMDRAAEPTTPHELRTPGSGSDQGSAQVVRGVGQHRADIRDADAVVGLLDGVDVVCHQAALVGAGVTPADLPLYASHNDLGTAVLLAAMSECRVDRLVLASSMVVYGDGEYACATHGRVRPAPRLDVDLRAGQFDPSCPVCSDPLWWGLVTEDARLQPRSSYAASKVAQEHYASAWAHQAPGSVITLRYHNVYGPQMPRDTPYSGVAAMFRSALERQQAPQVFEDGQQTRDFVHVDDVARANLAAIDAVVGAEAGSLAAYNVCSGQPISIGEVAALLATATSADIAPVVTGEFRSGDVRHIVASPERARTELGFEAVVDPAEGLRAFAFDPLRG